MYGAYIPRRFAPERVLAAHSARLVDSRRSVYARRDRTQRRLPYVLVLAAGIVLLAAPSSYALRAAYTQGLAGEVAAQVSWGSANGCVQNIQTNDFGALTPNVGSSLVGAFDASPQAAASIDPAGHNVWVGCVTANTGLASIGAQGLRDLTSASHTLALADVDIGLTNASGEKLNGGNAGCEISAGQRSPGACALPTGGSEDTLVADAEPGTTELNWQYQLDLPANQPVGDYTGGEVIFTATTGVPGESAPRSAYSPANTSSPTITGNAIEGQELVASPGGWTESPTSYSYRWQDCNSSGGACVNVSGATSSSYVLAASDVGDTVRVVVTASNAIGSTKASSDATATVAAAPGTVPDDVGLPTIKGSTVEGETLQANRGAWAGSPTSFAYQWEDCDTLGDGCLNINGATSSTYTLSALDVGDTVRVAVTATNSNGVGKATSAATTTILPLAPSNTAAPTVSGSAIEGQTLSAANGTWSGDPTSYGYQWEDCDSAGASCSDIDGARSASYQLAASDVGHTVRITVTASNAGGSTSATSAATATVSVPPPDAPANTGLPELSPSAPQQAVAEFTSNGMWSNSPTSYAYQWERCNSAGEGCASISGATAASYTPSASDVGFTLRAQVTATNSGGSAAAISNATGLVASMAAGTSYTQTVDSPNSLNAVSCIPASTTCVLSDSKGNALYSTNVSASASATWKSWSGPGTSPSEAVDCPTSSLCLLADGTDSNSGRVGGTLYYAASLGGSWSEAYHPVFGVNAISCPSSSLCVNGQDGGGFFRYSVNPASSTWKLEEQGSSRMGGVFCLSTSFCALADSAGSVHLATTNSKVESEFWTATDVDGSSALNGVACTSTTSCVAVNGAGYVLDLAISGSGAATATKHHIDGTNSLTAITCTAGAFCVTVNNQGNIFISTDGGGTWSKQYTVGTDLTSVSCASALLCAAADTSGRVTSFD